MDQTMANEEDTNTQPAENNLTSSTEASDTSNQLSSAAPAESPASEAASSTNTSSDAPNEGGSIDESQKKTPWFQRRIDQLTAEKWEERRAAEALRKQAADLLEQLASERKKSVPAVDKNATATDTPAAAKEPTPAPTGRNLSDAEINALAEQRAEQIARERAFNKACNDVAAAGKEEYTDFDQSLRTFQMLGGIPTGLLETLTEMPNAHKVLYALGKDPDLAERVVKMGPGKQALELARLESSVAKPSTRQVSSAPAPVKPIESASRASGDMERMSMEDFVAAREKQLANRKR